MSLIFLLTISQLFFVSLASIFDCLLKGFLKEGHLLLKVLKILKKLQMLLIVIWLILYQLNILADLLMSQRMSSDTLLASRWAGKQLLARIKV